MDDMTEVRECVECSRTDLRKNESDARFLLRKSENRSDGELLYTGGVTKLVGNVT